MPSRLLTSISPLILGSSILLMSASASAQPSAVEQAQGMHQDGVKARDAKKHDLASTLFEQAYRVHPRALYLYEAAASNQYGDDMSWALMLAQCAQVEEKSPLDAKTAAKNKALVAALEKKTSSRRPESLSFYCTNLNKDVRMGRSPSTLGSRLLGDGSQNKVEEGGGAEGFGRIRGLGKVDRGDEERVVYGGQGKVDPDEKASAPRTRKKKVRPVMKLKALKTTGSCDDSNIRRVQRSKFKAFRFCYEKELQKNPSLKGDFTLSWTISKEGKTADIKTIKDNLKDPKVAGCAERIVRRMRFVKLKKTCTVKQTFEVKPMT